MAIERQHRPIDKEFEEADYSGILDISGRKLRLFPNIGDDVYDPLEIFTAGEFIPSDSMNGLWLGWAGYYKTISFGWYVRVISSRVLCFVFL